MVGFNAALRSCGVQKAASAFFVSSATGALSDLVCVAQALAFVVEEEDLGHSLAVCPTPPQNRQRLLLNRHVRSACVSFPSLPSLSERLGFFFLELLNELPSFKD